MQSITRAVKSGRIKQMFDTATGKYFTFRRNHSSKNRDKRKNVVAKQWVLS